MYKEKWDKQNRWSDEGQQQLWGGSPAILEAKETGVSCSCAAALRRKSAFLVWNSARSTELDELRYNNSNACVLGRTAFGIPFQPQKWASNKSNSSVTSSCASCGFLRSRLESQSWNSFNPFFPGLHNFFVFDSSSVGMARATHIRPPHSMHTSHLDTVSSPATSSAQATLHIRLLAANYFFRYFSPPLQSTPRGFEPLRAEPNGFRVHLLSRSDTVSTACTLQSSLFRQTSSATPHGRPCCFLTCTHALFPSPCNKYTQAQKVQWWLREGKLGTCLQQAWLYTWCVRVKWQLCKAMNPLMLVDLACGIGVPTPPESGKTPQLKTSKLAQNCGKIELLHLQPSYGICWSHEIETLPPM